MLSTSILHSIHILPTGLYCDILMSLTTAVSRLFVTIFIAINVIIMHKGGQVCLCVLPVHAGVSSLRPVKIMNDSKRPTGRKGCLTLG